MRPNDKVEGGTQCADPQGNACRPRLGRSRTCVGGRLRHLRHEDGTIARDECPAGQYFVGVVGLAGVWLDQITVACAKLNADQKFSGPKLLPSRGGSGGGFKEAYCPSDAAVTGVSIRRSPDYKIVSVHMTCKSLKTCEPTGIALQGSRGAYAGDGEQNCVSGELATGLINTSMVSVSSAAAINLSQPHVRPDRSGAKVSRATRFA